MLTLKKKRVGASKGIRCPGCRVRGHIVGIASIIVKAPLAKGGGIKMGGIPVTHAIVKAAWDKQTRKLCVCQNCKASLTYETPGGLKVTR